MAGFFSFFRKKTKNEDKKSDDKLQQAKQEQSDRAAQQSYKPQTLEGSKIQEMGQEQSNAGKPQTLSQSAALKAKEPKVEPALKASAQDQIAKSRQPKEEARTDAQSTPAKTEDKKNTQDDNAQKTKDAANTAASDVPKDKEGSAQKAAGKKKVALKNKAESANIDEAPKTDASADVGCLKDESAAKAPALEDVPKTQEHSTEQSTLPRRGKRKAKQEQKKEQNTTEQKEQAQPAKNALAQDSHDAQVSDKEQPSEEPSIEDQGVKQSATIQSIESKAVQISQDGQDADEAASKEKSEEALSFFERLKKTRENLAFGISAFVKGRQIDDELYDDLETALLTADLGVETTQMVIDKLKNEAKLRELHDAALLKKRLALILYELLEPCQIELKPKSEDGSPFVILMVGVNGAGKTTTIGKLAAKFQEQGLKVMLAAGDTFRAAASEQLKEWGQRAGVPVIAQDTGSDSASVLYDALSSAKARKADVLICDTAGRLQNKENLMNELKKIVRVLKKIDEKVPHEVLLVLDAATGQNAVSQTRLFKEAVDVTGLCLTKLDGSAKGGVVFALASQFKLPIRYAGIGEKASDLRVFKVKPFVDALLDLQ